MTDTNPPADRTAAIRVRLDAATPGPWTRLGRNSCKPDEDDWFLGHEIEGPPDASRGQFERVADAELVANAPTDLAYLLARVEELERQLATAREEAAGKALLAAISNIETVIDALTVTKGANFSGAISGLERAKSILHSRAEQAAKAYRAALGTAGPEPLRGPDTAMDEFEAMDDIDRRWE